MMTGSCDMMVADASFRYFAADTYEVIQLPYRSSGNVKGNSAMQVLHTRDYVLTVFLCLRAGDLFSTQRPA
jgi:hypothetical protein